MITTLLFDLDDTLVQMNRQGLTWSFLALLVPVVRGVVPLWRLYPVARTVIRKTKSHGSHLTNFEAMTAALCQETGVSHAHAVACIRRFEATFERMAWRFKAVPHARETLELAEKLGYRLALATNPSTPQSMVKARLRWAGLEHVKFEFCTHSEVMTRCKPDPAYYEELCQKWTLVPQQCLMIGNDVVMDLPAADAGIHTFLLSTSLAPRLPTHRPPPDYIGDYSQLQALLRQWAGESAERLPSNRGFSA